MASAKHRKHLIILALLLVSVAAGVWLARRLASRSIDHIILISLDTCRADHLSCYGFNQTTTPNIDAVADEGFLFENALSPVPLTLPAHCSMLTGTIPPFHGVHNNVDYQLAQDNLTLAEILGAKAYKTGAIISTFVLDSRFGMDQGFDTYNDTFEESRVVAGVSERNGAEATRVALEWLEEHQREKFFLFLHYYDPHYDYVPPEPFASQFPESAYAGEIAFTDHCVGQVLDKLKALGIYDSALVIIVGDHGEMLGEHGEKTHTYFIYQSALKVPLIFKLPGSHESQRIPELVGIVDIVPTVCRMLRIPVPEPIQGYDLSPWFRGKAPAIADRHVYCETVEPLRFGANSLLGIVDDRFKYIQTTRPELYDLVEDPAETNNLIETQPALAETMKHTLAQVLEQTAREDTADSRITLDAQAIERLESLGYVGGGSVTEPFTFDQSKTDPKDLIEFVMAYEDGLNLAHERKAEEAIAAYARAIAMNPTSALPYNSRATMHMAKGDHESAIRDFDQAITIDPDFSRAFHDRGVMFLSVGNFDRAIADFDRAIELNPASSDIHNNRGLAYYSKNDVARALRDFDRAIELDPEYVEVYGNRAQSYLRTGRPDLAIADYDQLISLDPQKAQAYNDRGLAYYSNHDYAQAIRDFDTAIQLDPNHGQAFQCRGYAHIRTGQTDEAIRDFRRSIELNPADSFNHKVIGEVFMSTGKAADATRHYYRALQLKGDWPEVLNNLAWILATHADADLRNGAEAIRLAEEACRLQNYRNPSVLDTLAAAHAETGDFDQAIQTAETAHRLASATPNKDMATKIQNRLELYRTARPYRQSSSGSGASGGE